MSTPTNPTGNPFTDIQLKDITTTTTESRSRSNSLTKQVTATVDPLLNQSSFEISEATPGNSTPTYTASILDFTTTSSFSEYPNGFNPFAANSDPDSIKSLFDFSNTDMEKPVETPKFETSTAHTTPNSQAPVFQFTGQTASSTNKPEPTPFKFNLFNTHADPSSLKEKNSKRVSINETPELISTTEKPKTPVTPALIKKDAKNEAPKPDKVKEEEPKAPVTTTKMEVEEEPKAPVTTTKTKVEEEPKAPVTTTKMEVEEEPKAPVTTTKTKVEEEPKAPVTTTKTKVEEEPKAPVTTTKTKVKEEPKAPVTPASTKNAKNEDRTPSLLHAGSGTVDTRSIHNNKKELRDPSTSTSVPPTKQSLPPVKQSVPPVAPQNPNVKVAPGAAATISRSDARKRTALKVTLVVGIIITAFAALCFAGVFPQVLLGSKLGCCLVMSTGGVMALGSGFTLKLWKPKAVGIRP